MKAKILAIALLTSGCGALVNDDNSTVTLSAPEGVTLTVDGMKTPAGETEMSNRKSHVVMAYDKDGKVIGECHVDTTVMARYIVADVFLGLLPLAVDAFTGSWTRLDKGVCSFFR
jgi:hypothetical protein